MAFHFKAVFNLKMAFKFIKFEYTYMYKNIVLILLVDISLLENENSKLNM